MAEFLSIIVNALAPIVLQQGLTAYFRDKSRWEEILGCFFIAAFLFLCYVVSKISLADALCKVFVTIGPVLITRLSSVSLPVNTLPLHILPIISGLLILLVVCKRPNQSTHTVITIGGIISVLSENLTSFYEGWKLLTHYLLFFTGIMGIVVFSYTAITSRDVRSKCFICFFLATLVSGVLAFFNVFMSTSDENGLVLMVVEVAWKTFVLGVIFHLAYKNEVHRAAFQAAQNLFYVPRAN